ncbi:MAG TPA: tetratricopeptide repeat protein [Candidatus Binataceae bacterium]|nr:tetratricopeptide repeat protein [Candidatus Binataceae bacterium]
MEFHLARDSSALFAALTLIAVLIAPAALAQDSNTAKAHALVEAAIKMTDSNAAVKLLWQATDIDPAGDEAYVYLGEYYNSRSDPENVVKVYQKFVKNKPHQVAGYLNIGEAYLSFSPPRTDDALAWFHKAYALEPTNSFAALRIGEVLMQQGSRDEAAKYLRIAMADRSHNPSVSAEAEHDLKSLGAL